MFKICYLLSFSLAFLTLPALQVPTNPPLISNLEHQIPPIRPASALSSHNSRIRKGALFIGEVPTIQYGGRIAPHDIVLPHNTRSPTQGRVGACHIFTMTQVLAAMIFKETGQYINPTHYFADHLAQRSNTQAARPLETFMNTHINDIEAIKAGKACNHMEFEGGFFTQDLKLLQTVGSELIASSAQDYSSLVTSVEELRNAKKLLINHDLKLDYVQKQRILENPVKSILSKTIFRADENSNRALVKAIVRNVKFKSLRFNNQYGSLPIGKAYLSAKMNLIDMLHKNGVLWLGVDAGLFYGRMTAKLEVGLLFAAVANHAIALVGYKTEGDMFLIKDSSREGLLEIPAMKLLPSISEAYALNIK